ncbi:MAG: isocitrate/isopropylmalate dehydrogenase family protein [Candidatus Bathyarchaeota archaeon]|nr:isocitrate/isopropylmalate dehydrogenase family protein [Candidatus Bathyarchaeota archaeon]
MTKKYKIAVMPGDGIGEEVTSEAIKVLEATGLIFETISCTIGGTAYLKNGDPLPPESVDACAEADAVLFGAVGHDYVSYDIPRKVLIYLRLEKDAFANIRPLKTYPGVQSEQQKKNGTKIDMVIVRDNAEGFSLQHSGLLGKSLGTDRRVITQYGANRIIDFAHEYAMKNNRKKITCIDQSNWLYSDKFFRSVFEGSSERYSTFSKDFMHVDVAAMMLSKQPENFDVIVTPDIYGDILSGIVISKIGGVGMAPSACIGDKFAFFEPIHGTAWDIAGKGIANPIASIFSAKLMLEWLGRGEEAQMIENAVSTVLQEGEVRTPDIGGFSSTSEVGDAIASCMM